MTSLLIDDFIILGEEVVIPISTAIMDATNSRGTAIMKKKQKNSLNCRLQPWYIFYWMVSEWKLKIV